MLNFYKYLVRPVVKLAKRDSFDPQSSFKIYFNLTDRISAKTPLQIGTLTLRENEFEITGDTILRIQFSDITSLRLEFPHSSAVPATVIQVKYQPNEIFYFGVIRSSSFKIFVSNNLRQTIALFEKIKKNVPQNIAWSALD